LVYKPEYRTQVLHHATVANLKYVLFVVAGTTKIHYAVLIRFPEVKLTIMRGILAGIYQRSLKWAYTSATVNPLSIIPTFREEVILLKSYPNDPKNGDAKIAKTTIYCSVCLVHLCTRRIDNRRTTCFERFHQIQDLSDLKVTRSPSSAKGSSSKKRKQTDAE
jgi:hypothetical protein